MISKRILSRDIRIRQLHNQPEYLYDGEKLGTWILLFYMNTDLVLALWHFWDQIDILTQSQSMSTKLNVTKTVDEKFAKF